MFVVAFFPALNKAWCQFNQHFKPAFFIQNFGTKITKLCFGFETRKKLPKNDFRTKNVHAKHWWNWPLVSTCFAGKCVLGTRRNKKLTLKNELTRFEGNTSLTFLSLLLSKLGSISSTLYLQIFHTNVHFGSFYYVRITRKSCRNDVRTKTRAFYVDEIDT